MNKEEVRRVLERYQGWLTHREYSPATVEKYSRTLHRFFQETGAGARPEREAVAAWRDSLVERGYSPATVNVMVAAVNDYQESVDNPPGEGQAAQAPAAGVLRRGAGAEPGGVLPPAGGGPEQRGQAHPAAAPDHLFHGNPGVGAAVYHGGGDTAAEGEHPVQGEMPGDPAALGAVQAVEALV